LYACFIMQVFLKKHVFVPQDHGSWVFILSPLLIGICAGKTITLPTLWLLVTAMAAFLIRQPITVITKILTGRRSIEDLPAARIWVVVYASLIVLGLIPLIYEGFSYLLFLAIPGVPVFLWHLWLVGRRAERKQAGVEVIATGVLSLTAPAAYWIGVGDYSPLGWWLWCLTWLQSSASIVYAYLRLEQRGLNHRPSLSDRYTLGRRALVYTSFNLIFTTVLSGFGFVPPLTFTPFLLQWVETLWGITHPAAGWKPTQIGIRQLIVSTLWTILFILAWQGR